MDLPLQRLQRCHLWGNSPECSHTRRAQVREQQQWVLLLESLHLATWVRASETRWLNYCCLPISHRSWRQQHLQQHQTRRSP